MNMIVTEITDLLVAAFPDGEVTVSDPMSDGAHLTATVVTPSFEGANRVARHRMVYAALGNAFESRLHALQLVTKAPSEI